MLSPDKLDDRLRVRFGFEDWLAKKPRDEIYQWTSVVHCACAQFIRAEYGPVTNGERLRRLFGRSKPNPDERLVWEQFNHVAEIKPHTFGALLERVRAL